MRLSQDMSGQGELLVKRSRTEMIATVSSLVSSTSNFQLENNIGLGICRNGMLSVTGKRIQLMKMLTMTIFPIMVLWGFTVYTMTESLDEKSTAQQNKDQLIYTTEMAQFLHHLQRERDISVLYLSELGPETTTFLLDIYIETDKSLVSLPSWPHDITSAGINDPIFGSRAVLMFYISGHRQRLLSSNSDIYYNIDFYNYIIDSLISWLTTVISNGRYSSVWRTLIAYIKIAIGKQDVGVERALGAYFFIKGGFNSQEAFEAYNRRVHKFKAFYYTANMYSGDVDDLYEEGYLSASYNVASIINTYREEIQISNERTKSPDLNKAQWWFDNMTIYMDALFALQLRLGKIATSKINIRISAVNDTLAVSISFLVLVAILSPFVALSSEYLTSSIQNYAITLVEKTNELKKEKARTDSLLYQMVPKTIADKLTQNVQIDTEYFKSATIFFIDIFDFNNMVLSSTPIEIVELLNSLYSIIDERLDSFDVYKVETISDSYMVASGLPKRNRERHVVEIANLSLNLQSMIIAKPIAISKDIPLKLRFGINTGPCMAGVVGLTMPRYCLFGDTINTASRMKSYGLANRIHISHATYLHLSAYGGYVMKKRMKIEVKGKGEMQTHWLLGKRGEMEKEDMYSTADLSARSTVSIPGEISHDVQPVLATDLRVSEHGRLYPTTSFGKRGGGGNTSPPATFKYVVGDEEPMEVQQITVNDETRHMIDKPSVSQNEDEQRPDNVGATQMAAVPDIRVDPTEMSENKESILTSKGKEDSAGLQNEACIDITEYEPKDYPAEGCQQESSLGII